MLLTGRPLYDNQGDAALFVNPPEWDPLMRALERRLNVLLLGVRGGGKTTLLHQVELVLRGQGEQVVFVDAGGAGDVLALATRVRERITGRPTALEVTGSALEAFTGGEVYPGGASRQLGAQLRAIGEAPPAVIMVDGATTPEALFDLFGRMRDVLWQQPHHWVVALDARDRNTVMKPPADAFFDLVVTLDQWPINALTDLLSRRAEGELPDQLIAAAAAGAKGSPREALRALSFGAVSEEDPQVLMDARGRLLDRAAELGRAPSMLLAELLDRGSASPSDPELQESLGVTRARLTQMFHQLADRELVVAESERGGVPGRPRIVYRPNLPQ